MSETLYLEGPVVANLPVALSAKPTSSLWVHGYPGSGVTVVEGPLDYICSPHDLKGSMNDNSLEHELLALANTD